MIAKNVSCLKYWVHFFKGDSQLNSDLVGKFSRPRIVSKALSMMCHSIWQKVSFSPIPISGFWYVTDANSYLVFADVFVLVFLCYVSPRPFLWNATPIDSCWYIADALNGLWCTRCRVHEYAQLVFLWPDTKGNLSRLTRKIRTCRVSKVDYKKFLGVF